MHFVLQYIKTKVRALIRGLNILQYEKHTRLIHVNSLLLFQVGKLPSSVCGRSLIDVMMWTVSVIRSSFIPGLSHNL